MSPQAIYNWRTRHGLTQAEAGALVGVSTAAWRKWEADDRVMPIPVERLLVLYDEIPAVRRALEIMAQ